MLNFICYLTLFLGFGCCNVEPSVGASGKNAKQSSSLQVIRTLNEAIQAAYENNPSLQALRQQAKEQHEKVVQAQSGYLPTVEGKVGVGRNQSINSRSSKSSGSSQSEASNKHAGLTVRQNLFNGFSTQAGVEASQYAVRATWAQVLSKEQETLIKVVDTYLNLIKFKAQIRALKGSCSAFKQNYKAAVDKMKIGEETKTQVALAEANLMDAESKLEMAKAQYEGTKASLLALTGFMPEENVINPAFAFKTPDNLPNYIMAVMKDNPEVVAAEYEYSASKAQLTAQSRDYYPSIDLVASTTRQEDFRYGYNGGKRVNPGGFSRAYTTNNSIGVEVSYKFFDGGATASVSRAAREESIRKKISIEHARYNAKQEAIQNWQNILSLTQNVKHYKRQVNAYQVSLKGTQEELNVGTKILLDVLERQRDFLNAQLSLIENEKNLLLEQFKALAITGSLTPETLGLKTNVKKPQEHYNQVANS